ncbi:MotA/TolQ/ExbB proton channel family protein [Endozoicomonadaceae bacterium StTr2]
MLPAFFTTAGPFGLAIILTSTLMWWLILRIILRQRSVPVHLLQMDECQTDQQQDRNQQYLAAASISRLQQYLNRDVSWVRLLVKILPLLGLLGTVDGMITSFEHLGGNNGLQQQLADGISAAMLTTLAGLVTALSGLYLVYFLQRRAQRRVEGFRLQTREHSHAL